ncbi:MAG: phosphatase PAP2 family protein [Thermodesulfovibrionales bacterium]|nr:phosphatase PAP2 family protein [Thermodesulfovibrionales bacterium]
MLKKIRPSDSVTIFFALLFALLSLINLDKSIILLNLLILYVSFAFFQIFLILFSDKSPFLTLTRDLIFPIVAVFGIFDSLTTLIPLVNPEDLDHYLMYLDYKIFGFYPTVYMQRFYHPLISDVLQLCYSMYYFLPVILGIALKLKQRYEEFEKGLFLVLLCFYLSYVGYVLVPALGPRYAFSEFHTVEILDGLFSRQLRELLNSIEGIKRDAFPSGHTGVSLIVLLLSWQYMRNLFLPLVVIVSGLLVATVYFRFHYVVDIIGGIVLTVVTITIGKVYYHLYEKQKDTR